MASFELAKSAAGPDQGPLGAGQLPIGQLRCAPRLWPIQLGCLDAVVQKQQKGQFLILATPRSASSGDTREEMVQITPRAHRQMLGDPPRRHRRLHPQARRQSHLH